MRWFRRWQKHEHEWIDTFDRVAEYGARKPDGSRWVRYGTVGYETCPRCGLRRNIQDTAWSPWTTWRQFK